MVKLYYNFYSIGITILLIQNFAISQSFQKDKTLPKDTVQKLVQLNEVIVSASLKDEQARYVSNQVFSISKKDIAFKNNGTMANLLQNTGLVAVQKSQLGGGSPVLRGFEANRILLVVDGIRMNNLIYRGGHLQNVITVDQNTMQNVEVLHGSASNMYGSDALGGVIYMKTMDPFFAKNDVEFAIGYRPNMEQMVHGKLNIGTKKWAALSSITVQNFEDLRMGSKVNPNVGASFGLNKQFYELNTSTNDFILTENKNPLIQKNTGYAQADFLQKIIFMPVKNIKFKANLQLSSSTDIPRYDRLSGLQFKQWYYGPQNRRLLSLETENISKKWNLIFFNQKIIESRHWMAANADILNSQKENVNIYGANFIKNAVFRKSEFLFGADFNWQTVTSTSINTTTRYPGQGASQFNFNLFLNHNKPLKNNLWLKSGARLGLTKQEAKDNLNRFFTIGKVNQNYVPFSASSSLLYSPNAHFKVYFTMASGYRNPNIDDITKEANPRNGVLVVPNTNLKPEQTLGGEIGLEAILLSKIKAQANVFYTKLFNALSVNYLNNNKLPIVINGNDFIVLNTQNRGKAVVQGAFGQLIFNVTPKLYLKTSLTATKGDLISKNEPLDHIPPFFGSIAVGYQNKIVKTEFNNIFSAAKKLVRYSPSGEDNLQYAPANGSPAWNIFNIYTEFTLQKKYKLQINVENLLDLQYRTFASGINSPGRNFNIAFRKFF